jgi:hypothetical protein
MIGRAAATGLPRPDHYLRSTSPTPDHRPGQRHRDPGVAPPDRTAATQLGDTKVRFSPTNRASLAALLRRLPRQTLNRLRLLVPPTPSCARTANYSADTTPQHPNPNLPDDHTHDPIHPSHGSTPGEREPDLTPPPHPRRTPRPRHPPTPAAGRHPQRIPPRRLTWMDDIFGKRTPASCALAEEMTTGTDITYSSDPLEPASTSARSSSGNASRTLSTLPPVVASRNTSSTTRDW